MRTIKSIFASIVVIALSFLYVSCEPIDVDKYTTVEIPLEVSFEIPFNKSSDLKSASEDFPSIIRLSGESAPLNINDSIFDDLKQYKNNSIKLSVNNAALTIAGDGTLIKEVKNFASSANDEKPTAIGSYKKEGNIIINERFTDSKLADYFKAIIQSIQDNQSVVFDVAGEVDVPDFPELDEILNFLNTELTYTLKVNLSITAEVNLIK
jgi:hypothetical protein